MNKRAKIDRRTKLLDLQIVAGKHQGSEGVFFTFEGKRYFANRWTDQEPLNCVRWSPDANMYVTDAKRDFGGCGKDAVKLEVGIPFHGWISNAWIPEVEKPIQPEAVHVDLPDNHKPMSDNRPPSIQD